VRANSVAPFLSRAENSPTRDLMKISYDPEVDALSITFRDTTVTTKHLAEGIAADYDSEGRLAGLEILNAQKPFGGPDTIRRVELEGVGT